ncbi:MAG: ATP-binding protein, partial [Leptospirales bacterium]|nr:ATP-binding protein [Leptospirales bacterium]
LLSKIDFPNVNINEIPYVRIALIKNTAHAEMFRTWFPDAVNVSIYENADDAFLALELDKVEMVMAAKSKLLYYSNYYEFSGYKANYLFNYSYESALAFNKEQTILRSIMDKAFLTIDTDRLVDQWLTKTYDYKAQILAVQRPWLIGAIALSLVVLALTLVILFKNHNEKKQLAILTEKSLESEERLQILLDAMPISFHLINRDYEIFDCNQEAVNFVGAASKADLIKRYYDIFPEFQTDGQRTVDLRTEVLDKAFNDGWLRTECMHQSLDNDPVPLPSELTLIRFRHKGEDIIAACSRDLREQKAVIEEMHREGIIAEARSEAKSRFLAAMSHEIRTPMNSIMGFAELALNTLEIKTVPHLRSYFGKIIDSTKWLLKIINNILDVSKIESGSMELEKSPFDIYDVFLRCQSVILPDITEKGLELNVYAEPIPCKKLLGDPLRLYQALLNLLSNAVKFTDSGKITFSSLVRNMDDNKVTVYFEVKDTGIGMSSEQIEKIFDPFIQADSSTTRNYGGSGLGLTITKSIVELMGGKLSVESSPGIGSTFSFEIIFEAEDINIGYDPNHASLDVVEKPHFEGTILICDDNLLNQQVICEHLSNVGFKTVVVRNGKDGVDKVKSRMEKKERPFDLIFMDIFMPIMNGIEAAIKITELNTGTPIVALTANVMVSELEKYKKHGMSGFLGKPFTTQELWHILLQYLTPVNFSVIDKNHIAAEEEKLLMQLRLNFIKNNQTTFDDIKKAADAGDFALAKMIAHTLKGNAGQICEHGLKEAALRIENGEWGIEDMDVLKAELELVLEKLSPLLQEAASTQPAAADDEKTRELLEELEPMLISHNPLCINMLDEIRSIPGTGELVRHIEDFEFKQAILALEKFKKRGGQSNE